MTQVQVFANFFFFCFVLSFFLSFPTSSHLFLIKKPHTRRKYIKMATPTFGTFGKTANNLLNQKFEEPKDDFRNQASIKTQSNGFVITSTAVNADDNKVNAKVNVKYSDKSFGEGTIEYNTAAKIKSTLKLSKLQPGLVVSGDCELAQSKLNGKVTAEYIQSPIAATTEYISAKNTIQQTLVYGSDGISVGGSVIANVADPSDLKPHVGVQYEDGNLIGTLTHDIKAQLYQLTIFHRVNPEFQIASKFLNDAKGGNSLALGIQYKLNASTVVKGKTVVLNDGQHAYYGYIQHRMGQPNVNVGISTQYKSDKTSKFGINLEFGDI